MLTPVSLLAEFIQLQQESKDMDPMYPVMAELIKGMEPERQLWAILCYLAYYNIASGWEIFSLYPEPTRTLTEEHLRLPTGVERRNLRGGKPMAYHFASLVQTYNGYSGFDHWLHFHLRALDDKERGTEVDNAHWNWDRTFWLLQHIWGNGRWSGYKGCEVLQKVYGLPLAAPNMGNEFSSGPREGFALFRRDLPTGNSKAAIVKLDAFAEDLRTELRIFHGVEVPIEELETGLCDFHALAEGRYFVGHDIDQMMEQLRASKRPDLMEPVWAARQAVLPERYLGELNGWDRRDKRRMQVYKNMGRIIAR